MTMVKNPPLQTYTETLNVTTYVTFIDYNPRCAFCNKVLIGMATRPWRQLCRGCKEINYSATDVTV